MNLKEAIKAMKERKLRGNSLKVGRCVRCSKDFYTTALDHLYCSPKCAQIGSRKKFKSNCGTCRKTVWRKPADIPKARHGRFFCNNSCHYKFNRGENNRNWKGGTIDPSGYRKINVNGRQLWEHRVIMEKHLGRKLNRWEVVHHIDHNKLNNSIDNLVVLNNSEHSKMHDNLREYYPNLHNHRICKPHHKKDMLHIRNPAMR